MPGKLPVSYVLADNLPLYLIYRLTWRCHLVLRRRENLKIGRCCGEVLLFMVRWVSIINRDYGLMHGVLDNYLGLHG